VTTHFVADLHLHPARPGLAALFHRYLAGEARRADTLYILGDLFEVWVGDDGGLAEFRDTAAAIAALADHGTKVCFMRGNRDFAVGPEFAAACRLTVLDDPAVVDLSAGPALLSHGDLLCTDDSAHQHFRARYNDPRWRARMLRLPLWSRRLIARYARARSRAGNRNKPEAIMDVNAETVRRLMRRYQVPLLIHGHTHRPADHEIDLNGAPGQRLVLSDWHDDRGEVLVCDENGFRRLKT
jgi:UDP-2,3-diacylglucosamine hydrolase